MVLLDTETPGTSREIYSEDADGDSNSQPLYYKPSVLATDVPWDFQASLNFRSMFEQ